uniref:Uncharacterized protein n=1 Tax=Anguilla anguilla TaxID=7936 RepID=A0A0E9WPY3_ANGAN
MSQWVFSKVGKYNMSFNIFCLQSKAKQCKFTTAIPLSSTINIQIHLEQTNSSLIITAFTQKHFGHTQLNSWVESFFPL